MKYILLLILFSSCVTERVRQKICKSCALKDSVSLVQSVDYELEKKSITISGIDILANISNDELNSSSDLKPIKVINSGITIKVYRNAKGITVNTSIDSLKRVIELLNIPFCW
jgi:aspartyl aminopeptidase